MSMGPLRTPHRTGEGGAREGAESNSPADGRTAMLISRAGWQITSGRRTGSRHLADCQISSRTNAARSMSPPISTICTPKYTTFGILVGRTVLSDAIRMSLQSLSGPAIRFGRHPSGPIGSRAEAPEAARTSCVIVLYNTSRPAGLQELPAWGRGSEYEANARFW